MCRIRQHTNPTQVLVCTPNLHRVQGEFWGKSEALSIKQASDIRGIAGRLVGVKKMHMKNERETEA